LSKKGSLNLTGETKTVRRFGLQATDRGEAGCLIFEMLKKKPLETDA